MKNQLDNGLAFDFESFNDVVAAVERAEYFYLVSKLSTRYDRVLTIEEFAKIFEPCKRF